MRSAAVALTLLAMPLTAALAADPIDLMDLSLEQLGNVEVTSVSRRAERLSDAPASIYVIAREAIHRSGATSLPEALRLAPNLQVARIGSTSYAISARGFNNSLGNKLLVLIDGRIIYTPLFSGVFWDAQLLPLADVERIEVISGPGATLWGTNAVNGVINVITRRATDTRGGLLAAQGGEDERNLLVRQGGALGGGGAYRVYFKRDLIDHSTSTAGAVLPDAWNRHQFGFRADWGEAEHGFTLQGDRYEGESEARPTGRIRASGANVLATWSGGSDAGVRSRAQAYFDRNERETGVTFGDRMDIIDLEFVQSLTHGAHNLIWGGGYRRADDRVDAMSQTTFLPNRRTLQWANVFIQDEIAFNDTLDLTAGLKLDHNTYTGLEFLPNLRLAWKRSEDALWWASLAHAVRTPSRLDRELFLPANPPFVLAGGPNFRSEVADVIELGYRAQPTARVSYSVTLFHHRYDHLRSVEPQPDGSFQLENGFNSRSRGAEAWMDVQVNDRWRLSAGAVYLRQRFDAEPDSHDPSGPAGLGNDPRTQWSLRSTYECGSNLELSLFARRVGSLPKPQIESYTAVDAGLAWRPHPRLDVGLFLHNLSDSGHVEFASGSTAPRAEFDRNASLRLEWRW